MAPVLDRSVSREVTETRQSRNPHCCEEDLSAELPTHRSRPFIITLCDSTETPTCTQSSHLSWRKDNGARSPPFAV
jgi:hypothetical protein